MPEYKLYNMCMVYDEENGQVLVQDKIGEEWGGITFPGGKVEFEESFIESTIREVREETGLEITDLKSAGVINYFNTEDKERWICFLYKTNKFSGEMIKETKEGKVFWTDIEHLEKLNLAPNMEEYLKLFLTDSHNEAFANWNSEKAEELRII